MHFWIAGCLSYAGSLLGIIVHVQAFLMFVYGRAQGYLRDSLQSQTREQHRIARKFMKFSPCWSFADPRWSKLQLPVFRSPLPSTFQQGSACPQWFGPIWRLAWLGLEFPKRNCTKQVLSKYCLAKRRALSIVTSFLVPLLHLNWGQLSTAFVLLAILAEKWEKMKKIWQCWHCDFTVA